MNISAERLPAFAFVCAGHVIPETVNTQQLLQPDDPKVSHFPGGEDIGSHRTFAGNKELEGVLSRLSVSSEAGCRGTSSRHRKWFCHCGSHPELPAKLYCVNCSTGVCLDCRNSDLHRRHRLLSLENVARQLLGDLHNDVVRIARRVDEFRCSMSQTNLEWTKFVENLQKLRSLIETWQEKHSKCNGIRLETMLQTLTSYELREKRETASRTAKCELALRALECFMAYSHELQEKGSFNDLTRCVASVHSMASELLRTYTPPVEYHSPAIPFSQTTVEVYLAIRKVPTNMSPTNRAICAVTFTQIGYRNGPIIMSSLKTRGRRKAAKRLKGRFQLKCFSTVNRLRSFSLGRNLYQRILKTTRYRLVQGVGSLKHSILKHLQQVPQLIASSLEVTMDLGYTAVQGVTTRVISAVEKQMLEAQKSHIADHTSTKETKSKVVRSDSTTISDSQKQRRKTIVRDSSPSSSSSTASSSTLSSTSSSTSASHPASAAFTSPSSSSSSLPSLSVSAIPRWVSKFQPETKPGAESCRNCLTPVSQKLQRQTDSRNDILTNQRSKTAQHDSQQSDKRAERLVDQRDKILQHHRLQLVEHARELKARRCELVRPQTVSWAERTQWSKTKNSKPHSKVTPITHAKNQMPVYKHSQAESEREKTLKKELDIAQGELEKQYEQLHLAGKKEARLKHDFETKKKGIQKTRPFKETLSETATEKVEISKTLEDWNMQRRARKERNILDKLNLDAQFEVEQKQGTRFEVELHLLNELQSELQGESQLQRTDSPDELREETDILSELTDADNSSNNDYPSATSHNIVNPNVLSPSTKSAFGTVNEEIVTPLGAHEPPARPFSHLGLSTEVPPERGKHSFVGRQKLHTTRKIQGAGNSQKNELDKTGRLRKLTVKTYEEQVVSSDLDENEEDLQHTDDQMQNITTSLARDVTSSTSVLEASNIDIGDSEKTCQQTQRFTCTNVDSQKSDRKPDVFHDAKFNAGTACTSPGTIERITSYTETDKTDFRQYDNPYYCQTNQELQQSDKLKRRESSAQLLELSLTTNAEDIELHDGKHDISLGQDLHTPSEYAISPNKNISSTFQPNDNSESSDGLQFKVIDLIESGQAMVRRKQRKSDETHPKTLNRLETEQKQVTSLSTRSETLLVSEIKSSSKLRPLSPKEAAAADSGCHNASSRECRLTQGALKDVHVSQNRLSDDEVGAITQKRDMILPNRLSQEHSATTSTQLQTLSSLMTTDHYDQRFNRSLELEGVGNCSLLGEKSQTVESETQSDETSELVRLREQLQNVLDREENLQESLTMATLQRGIVQSQLDKQLVKNKRLIGQLQFEMERRILLQQQQPKTALSYCYQHQSSKTLFALKSSSSHQ